MIQTSIHIYMPTSVCVHALYLQLTGKPTWSRRHGSSWDAAVESSCSFDSFHRPSHCKCENSPAARRGICGMFCRGRCREHGSLGFRAERVFPWYPLFAAHGFVHSSWICVSWPLESFRFQHLNWLFIFPKVSGVSFKGNHGPWVLTVRLVLNELWNAKPGSICLFAICCNSFTRMSLGFYHKIWSGCESWKRYLIWFQS